MGQEGISNFPEVEGSRTFKQCREGLVAGDMGVTDMCGVIRVWTKSTEDLLQSKKKNMQIK